MKTMNKTAGNNRFVFFGTPDLAVIVLDELAAAGLVPSLIVTAPDAKQGRGMVMTPPPVKVWGDEREIEVLQPEKLDNEIVARLQKDAYDVFVVVAYGKILPGSILTLPKRGVLNVHPSLLPSLRGPSPVRSAILADNRSTGVTVMLLDEAMDHGPIIAQKKVEAHEWPPHAEDFEMELIREGGKMLASILPPWIRGEIEAHKQNDDLATYCQMIRKEDGQIDLNGDAVPAGRQAYQNLLKIRAYEGWPGTFSYFEKNGEKIRVKILDAHVENNELKIDTVVPEGKREMSYEEFLRSGAKVI
jgi:methionyl-tRNA formyltransferase